MPPVGGKPGPKRQKPDRLQGDRGYHSDPVRQVIAVAGDHPGAGGASYGARQRPGRVPLVRGADHRVAAFLRPAAPPFGPTHGDSRRIPPARLCLDLFEVPGPMTSFFPSALSISMRQILPTLAVSWESVQDPDTQMATCASTQFYWQPATILNPPAAQSARELSSLLAARRPRHNHHRPLSRTSSEVLNARIPPDGDRHLRRGL